jgi:host factor-I protein
LKEINEKKMKNFSRQPEQTAESRKKSPPVETNAETYYYKKQIDSRTQMVIVLLDGEEIRGTIEWYDLDALKVNRTDAPNILLPKHNIKYMYKAEDFDGDEQ